MQILDIYCYGKETIPKTWLNIYRRNADKLYIFEKPVKMIVNGQKKSLSADTLYFFPFSSDILPQKEMNEGVNHYYSDFAISPPIVSPSEFSLKFENMSETQKCAVELYKNLICQPKINVNLVTALIEYLVKAVTNYNNKKSVTDKIVTQAINYMHSEPIGDLSVKLLADKLGTTQKTLINHFVSHLRITPYSYYKNLRINYAKKLINHGSTLEEAAESTGYSEASALIRAMKEK